MFFTLKSLAAGQGTKQAWDDYQLPKWWSRYIPNYEDYYVLDADY